MTTNRANALQLTNSQQALKIVTLNGVKTEQDSTIEGLQAEIAEREHITNQKKVITEYVYINNEAKKEKLHEFLNTTADKEVIAWRDVPVPDDVLRLLSDEKRDSDTNKTYKKTTSNIITRTLSKTDVKRSF